MPKPTDALGNELAKGQLVRIRLEEASGFGRITVLREPDVINPTPGHIKILVEVDVAYIPKRDGTAPSIKDIVVVQEPEAMKKAMLAAKQANQA